LKRIASFAAMAAAAASMLWLAIPAGATAKAPPAIEHFQIVSTSATSNTASVVAWGKFVAGGTDYQGNSVDKLVFPNGSFRAHHRGDGGKRSLDPKTCLLTVREHGKYWLSDGTGAFRKLRGYGTYRLSILEVLASSNGRCTTKKPPAAFQQVITASGPVRF
jgi:hypothetical protein